MKKEHKKETFLEWCLGIYLQSLFFIVPIAIIILILGMAYFIIVHITNKYSFNLHYIYITCAVVATGVISFYKIIQYQTRIEYFNKEQAEKQDNSRHNPINFISRLDVDLFELRVGEDLVDMAEKFATEDDGIIALRSETADTLGFILSTIRVRDFSDLEPYEYNIAVRDNVVASGYVYPDKFMVLAREWDSRHKEIPENAIVGVEPVWQTQVYWIDKETADKNKKYIKAISPTDVIKQHLREIAIKYANDLITIVDVGRYIEQAKIINKGILSTLEKLNKRLSIEDIRQVFANLITEKVSVKDVCYIFERLADYARKSAEPDILSERIREDLKVQISAKNADANNVLYAINLSKEWEKTLEEHLERTALGYVLIMESEQISEFVETVATKLMLAVQSVDRQPVILCAPKNRLPIYKMLKRHIPTVVVMSYLEVADTVKLETVATIGEE